MTRHAAHPHSRRRRWLFRVAALLVGLAPLVIAEGLLRLLTAPPPATSADAVDGDPLVDLHQLRPLFVPADDRGRMEIPPQRMNFFRPASFELPKPPQTFRIFVVGGSTVQGRPYATETAFAAFLQQNLLAADPHRRWEVINCGGVSYASYRVAVIVDEVLRYQPDLIIVYTGHNEFLEDRTYAAWRRVPRPLAPLLAAGMRLRLVQTAATLLPSRRTPQSVLPGEVRARLDGPGGLEAYERDAAWRSSVIAHFQRSLLRIAQDCREADVPLVACVPASEIVATPPFKISDAPHLSRQQLEAFHHAWQAARDDSLSVELRRLASLRALAIDPHHAGAAYLLGRLRWDAGDAEGARAPLIVARDWDVCPLRAPTEIEQAVRDWADTFSLPLVDTPLLLDTHDVHGRSQPDGVPDPTWFVDHVHPSVDGHRRIADALFDQLVAQGWVQVDSADADDIAHRRQQAVQRYLHSIDEAYYQRGLQRREGLRNWAAGRAGQQGVKLSQPAQ